MIRVLPVLIQLALVIYCLIDCIQTDSVLVRNLPKGAWVLLIVFLPLVGSIAWLVAGRPQSSSYPAGQGGQGGQGSWRSTETAGFPEQDRPQPRQSDAAAIDDQLRRDQERVDREHEEALRKWEERERRRKLGEEA